MDRNVLEQLKEEAKSICDKLNYSLYDIHYGYDKENEGFVLTVEIDNSFHTTMEDIEAFGSLFNTYLDSNEDLISEPYFLNICSPGAVREVTFSDLDKIIGFFLKVTIKDSYEEDNEMLSSSSSSETTSFKKKNKPKFSKGDVLKGTLMEVDFISSTFVIKVNNKGKITNIPIPFNKVYSIYTEIKD